MALPAGYRPLPGSERPPIKGSSLIGPVPSGEHVTVTLLLRKKAGGPDLPDLEHWQNVPPGKRSFLSAEEFFEHHGAADADVDAVADYLHGKGLRVLEKHAGRRRIVAEGSAADVNAAFAITLNKYRAPERTVPRRRRHGDKRPFAEHMLIGEHTHRGFAGPAHLPAKLIGIVTAIIGLDDRRLGTPAGAGAGDPPGAGYLSPATIAQAYNFPTTAAVGQTIGLFEAADAGAAYLATDIQSFIQSLPGGLLLPNLTDVLLLGNINNPTNVTAPPNPGVAGAVFECTIDVSIAAAAASGVNINVYFTNGTEAGWEAFFSRAIFPLPGDNPPSVLSASWVPYLSDDGGTVGLLANPASPVSIFTGYLQSAAARGITVLMALGDWGANNLVFDTVCHVSYPNCDPWVTSCGGTILGAANPSPPPLLDEWTWSDANVASQFDLAPYDATGGGVSDTFARPPYQVAAGVLPVSKNDGNVRRGIPDVAGMVAMSGFFIAGLGGPGQNGGVGTSAVAPLYAGLIATINAFLGRAVGFLNPSLYAFGPQICNDIRIGNNDSGNLPDSPFYTAAVGWDTCTGWGSIDGLRLLSALAPAPIVATAIADTGAFGNACVGSFVDEVLTIDNSGFATLLIWSITSSSPAFEVPSVSSYPLAVAPGASIDVVIRFRPTAIGFASGTISIFSNDLFSPETVAVNGTAGAPRLVLGIANKGNFGNVCIGSFADEPLLVNNGGKCLLQINNITSSSAEFVVPEILSFPIAVAAGTSVSLPIRFQPTVLGPTPAGAQITVDSNDPGGPRSIRVSGNAPAGKLAVTGSTFFGGVRACCREERTISICNVGDCKLHVSSVHFKRKNRHWKLINNPFPATLHPGSCLAVVIRYKATEKFPHSCDLVIDSDDPTTPVKTLEVLASTIWSDCGCKKCCEECRKGCCEKRHCDPCCGEKCRGKDDDEHDDDDEKNGEDEDD